MDGALQRVAQVTLGGAESVVRALVRQGEVAADRAEQVLDDLLGRSESDRQVIAALVEDLAALRERVRVLEARLAAVEAPRPPATGAAVGERP